MSEIASSASAPTNTSNSNDPGPGLATVPKTSVENSRPVPAEKVPATDKPEAGERRKYTFKVDGKEVVKHFNEEELQVYLQKGYASDKRFQETAKQRAEIERLLASGKENFAETVKKIWGIDPLEWAEKELAQKWNRASLSEEERKALEKDEELARYKKQIEDFEKQKTLTQQQQYEEQVWQETEREVMQALTESGLAKNHETLELVSSIAIDALQHGVELTPKQIVAEARNRAGAYAKSVLFSLKGNSLLEALGPDVVREVIQAEVTKRRAGVSQPSAGAVQPPPPPPANLRRPGQAQPEQPQEKKPFVSTTRKRIALRYGLNDD